ncbi:type II toxin-antitoxin system RelE/ParE family toxin [Acidithiobacillus sulfurivorans]|uniref:Type II toxin-antitoxin system RelE/ParE family toxin n=1 Tax=Acidithiobacillus sulfurivorans TaxID=1958756 RepID=A0ABS6A1G6_9PROT|nr:type II toxin-antitoxin system RelE/ParE family toxin [Acidithiobacillus sulfurivorans]
MQIKFVRKALRDLDDEAAYIATYSPQAAQQFMAAVHQCTGLLGTYPAMGRPGRVSGTRELVMTDHPYILPYRVRDDAVEILRVFHSRQKLPRRWSGSD